MKAVGGTYKMPVKVLKIGKKAVPKEIEVDGQVYILKGGYVNQKNIKGVS